MKKIYKYIIILISLCLLICCIVMLSWMKRIPNEKWFMVEPGMNLEEIEAIVGPPNHPSRDLKEMDRWIIDSGLFNSRLTVYYRNPKHPLIASGIEITRYCKLTNSYSIKIKK